MGKVLLTFDDSWNNKELKEAAEFLQNNEDGVWRAEVVDECGSKCKQKCNTQNEDTKLIDAYQRHVEALTSYIKLLGEELDELVPLATMHGWKSSRYGIGKELRTKIAESTIDRK